MAQTFKTLLIILTVCNYFINCKACFPKQRNGLTIKTDSGQVQGSIGRSRGGRDYLQFFRIPFAQPPIGRLRFASPVPIENWEGILDGRRRGPTCAHLQQSTFFQAGDEDCLYLNVYVPRKFWIKRNQNNNSIPVMVWIHGGAFVQGSANRYNPGYFMDEDIVFVSINYRLGILGFLTTGDKEIRGNMGLKDQLMALKWIKRNIKYFGGDDSKITIMGESAGGASVHFLMLSKTEELKLFHKGISMSGTAITPWAYQSAKTSTEITKNYAAQLNCPTNSTVDMTACLRALECSKLLSATRWDMENLYIIHPTLEGDFLRPVVEVVDDKDAFLTQSPLDIIIQGQAHKIPWLAGVVAEEGLFSSMAFVRDPSLMSKVEENWNENGLHFLNVEQMPKNISLDIRTSLKNFYLDRFGSNLTNEEKHANFTKLYTDALFLSSLNEAADIQRKFSPVYTYFFNKTGGTSFAPFLTGIGSDYRFQSLVQVGLKFTFKRMMGLKAKNYGVCHADDLFMMFPFGSFTIPKNDEDQLYKFSKNYVKLWTKFAYDETSMKFEDIQFLPNSPQGKLNYLNFDDTKSKIIDDLVEERLQFWKSLNVLQKYSDAVKKSMNMTFS